MRREGINFPMLTRRQHEPKTIRGIPEPALFRRQRKVGPVFGAHEISRGPLGVGEKLTTGTKPSGSLNGR